MIRGRVLLFAITTAACAPSYGPVEQVPIAVLEPAAPQPPSTPSGSAPPPPACNPASAQVLVGQIYTPAGAEVARAGTGARILRVLRPDEVAVMDYRPDRLTLSLDDRKRIVRAACG